MTVGSKSYQNDTGKPKDTVITTDPLNGVRLNKGGKVNLVLSSGQSSSKPVSVYVDLPQNVTHDLVLKAYLDGSLDKTMTVNPSYNPTTQLTYSGYTGQHKLVVALDDSTYREYTLDFSTGTPKPGKRYDYKPSTTSSSQSSQASSSTSSGT